MCNGLRIVFFGLILTSCAASVKTNLANDNGRDKLKNSEVFVFYTESELPAGSIEIGSFKVGDSGFSTKCSKEEVVNDARKTAKTNNANIVLIDKVREPGYLSSCYRLNGRFFYNNSENMSELWKVSDNVFDENADYARIHFICKGEKPSGYTYMKAGLVGKTYTITLGDEKFKISEKNVVIKEFAKEGKLVIKGSSYTRSGEVEINIQFGHEYFISVTTHTNFGTRVVLEEVSPMEAKRIKLENGI